jgi:tetratricopeptide (TPR) repeat protein
MALALKLSGDPDAADAHYAQALRHARAAGDLVQASRVLTNQSHELLTRGRYPEALATARAAVPLAEQAGPAGTVVIALCNEAEALNRLGRFDESVERYSRVLAICQRVGLRRAAAALAGLGDVHHRRGWREQARVAYEQALSIARQPRGAGARPGAHRSGSRPPRRGSRSGGLRARRGATLRRFRVVPRGRRDRAGLAESQPR